MTWNEFLETKSRNARPTSIEYRVLDKLGGRLEEFSLDDVGGQLVLRGRARSYHVKQLAQHEVMALTGRQILGNRIEVLH